MGRGSLFLSRVRYGSNHSSFRSQSAYAIARDERDKQTQMSFADEWPSVVPPLRTFKPKIPFIVAAKENAPENVRRLNGLNLHSNGEIHLEVEL